MIVQNFNDVGTTVPRRIALKLIETGIQSVLPETLLRKSLEFDPLRRLLRVSGDEYALGNGGRLFVIGGGKAAGKMAAAIESIIGTDLITAGLVITKSANTQTECIEILDSGHPIPDERGILAVSRMLRMKTEFNISTHDIIICLISGGASALMPAPATGVMLKEKQQVTDLLLKSGATIHEINTVRKHLSHIKGGGLGRHFSPAIVISLIISDVTGNDPATIGSGLTAADPSTFADAIEILERYGLIERVSPSVVDHMEKGNQGEISETPKELPNCYNYIIGENRNALKAIERFAIKKGLKPLIISSEQTGETGKVAVDRANEIISGKFDGLEVLIIGGETTPKLSETPGRGGRNQHYAAISLLAMNGYKGKWVVASVGTDGTDYIADVAGAIIDDNSLERARTLGIDVEHFISNFNSNTLFSMLGNSLIVTGDTGTNTGDIMIYIFPS